MTTLFNYTMIKEIDKMKLKEFGGNNSEPK